MTEKTLGLFLGNSQKIIYRVRRGAPKSVETADRRSAAILETFGRRRGSVRDRPQRLRPASLPYEGLDSFEQFLAAREQILPWIAEYSPSALVTADDPPVYLLYNAPPAIGQEQKDPTHTSNFGVKLQERCHAHVVACELVYPGVKHAPPHGLPDRDAQGAGCELNPGTGNSATGNSILASRPGNSRPASGDHPDDVRRAPSQQIDDVLQVT
jgi:hypothetical protein